MFALLYKFNCSSEESDDEDDDEQELQAELQRIKEEREAAQNKKVKEEQEIQQRMNRDNAIKGNPLTLIEENSAKVFGCVLTQFFLLI